MISITILAVGKMKESYYQDAMNEYAKRLSRYCKYSVDYVMDEATPDACSDSVSRQILDREATKLLAKIKSDDYVIALDLKGDCMDSEFFAEHIRILSVEGVSKITFVIGGSLGLSESLLQRANERLCFSKFTFPHTLMRVILAEQIYRCFRIQCGQPYHK